MSNLQFRMMGPLEVLRDGQPVALGGRQQRMVLALLLIHANQPLSADRLVEELWGEPTPPRALKRLQLTITRLRKALGAAGIETVAGGYRLTVRPADLDAEVFRARVQDGRRALEDGEPARAAELLRAALSVWRGPPLADLAYEPFAAAAIRNLDDVRVDALELAIEADLGAGRHRDVVLEIETLVAAHPLRERLHAQRMVALYRCGRQSEALDAYRFARSKLIADLGLEPGPELRQLEAQILTHSPALAAPVPRGARAWIAASRQVAEPAQRRLTRARRRPVRFREACERVPV